MRQLWYNYLYPLDPDLDTEIGQVFSEGEGRGLEIAYYRHFGRGLHLGIPVKLGSARLLDANLRPSNRAIIGNLDLLLHQNLFKYGNLINPTIDVGLGSTYNFDAEDFDFNVPVGIGLNIRLLKNFYFTANTQYRFSFEDQSGWHHGLGLLMYIGIDPNDRDDDGITNANDKCPDVAGPADKQGCPDRDNDNIVDIEDRCPDVAGLSGLQGCPDRDGDNIADMDDACPDVRGVTALNGCPDADSDGIEDSKDKCPNESGPASNEGCPIRDRDSDGVVDAEDACPDLAGPAATRGCPDRDNDGVLDRDDACPELRGDAAHKGCPDSDGDGVFDNDDRCPTLPGPGTNRGCPELKRQDREIIDLAVRMVQFETGKATLLKQSFKVLDDVAGVLLRYPHYSVSLKGHTDSQGEAKYNKDLSNRRAKTCFDYLVSKGVPAERLSSAGFGEEQPIADNMNAAGRAKNRRVEFELYIK